MLPYLISLRGTAALTLALFAPTSIATAAAPQDSRSEAPDPVVEAAGPPIRVGLRARSGGADRLTSLRYIGGFETKTLLLETLVRRGPDGRVEGAILSDWDVEDGGKTFRLRVRDDAVFHDGTPVTAEVVCAHFRRWVGDVEHDWLRANRHIESVEAVSEQEVLVRMDQPYALLDDLLAINPCALVAPSSDDWEGEFMRPIGTGPFRFVAAFDDGARWRLAAVEDEGRLLDVTFYPRGRDSRPIDDLVRGAIDVFVGGWDEDLPAERVTEIEQDPRFSVVTAPGSSVVYLSFRMTDGPTSDVDVRQRIAAAVDRAELLRIVEGGRADACYSWAAPSVLYWPRGPARARARERERHGAVDPGTLRGHEMPQTGARTRLVVSGSRGGRAARVAIELVAQLRRAGFDAEYLAPPAHLREASRVVVDAHGAVRPLTTESGEVRARAGRAARERGRRADVRVQITHGMPYCPHQSLVARFGAPRDGGRPRDDVPEALRELVEAAAATPHEDDRIPLYSQIQTLMDEETLIVPLYVPWRIALSTADIEGIRLSPDVYHVDLTQLRRTAGR